MKLNDVYTKPLKDVVEGLNLTDMKVHTDDDGEVRSIELKYEPNNRITKGAQQSHHERSSVMLLKEIGRKIAQAFRLARAADEKAASSIAAALDAKAEQIKEYEKRFEPEHPEPEPLPMQQVIQSLAAYGFSTDEAACAIAKAMAQKPKPLRNLTNNWRKMHGLPMHRKPTAFRRRRKGNGTGKQSK